MPWPSACATMAAMAPELAIQLLQLLGPVAISALTWAAGQLAAFFAAKTKNQNIGTAINMGNDAAVTVVSQLEQTLVATLKAKSGQGTLTGKDIEEVQKAALDNMRSYLGPNGLALICKALGIKNDDKELGAWLAGKVQAAVYSMRPGANPSLPSFDQGVPGITVYNQQPGQVQKDGSTSTGLPAFGGMTGDEKKGAR